MSRDKDLRRNGSGYLDLTSYNAIKHADKLDTLDKKLNEEYNVNVLIKSIYRLCNAAGYSIEERIVLKDRKTGKIYR